jgi:hypothetical protein
MQDEKFINYINSGVDGMIFQQKPVNDIHGQSINTTQAYSGLTRLELFALTLHNKGQSIDETIRLALHLLAELHAFQLNNQPKKEKDAINVL